MVEYGALSLIPPLLAIGLAIVTRKAVLSLFLGVWAGGVIKTGSLGLAQTFNWIVAAVGASEFHAKILIFTLLLGSAVALIWRMGGSHAVRNWALQHLDTKQKVGIGAWLLGVLIFFDDYANTAIVGSTVKDVSDHVNISREKLSYVVDSTAAPVATIAISSWVAFQIGQINSGLEAAGAAGSFSAFEIFLESIQYNMYSILAIAMVGIIVIWQRDFGEMLTAEHRAAETGKVLRDGANPMQDVESNLGNPNVENPRLLVFFAPIAVLLVVTIGAALYTGALSAGVTLSALGSDPGGALYDAITNAPYADALLWGSFAMVVSSYVLAWAYDIMSLGDSVDTTIDGFGVMLTAVTILVLAWGIGNVVAPVGDGGLGTANYVTGIAENYLTANLLPVVVLFTAAFVAFATGTSWGTMGIVTPIAVPVALNLGDGTALVAAAVGAVFSGAIFGDHTSPISDTTVLSSTFTGADHIDHVRTQLYYAVTVVLVAAVLLLVWGYTGITPLVLLPLGVVALVALVYGLSEFDARRRGISPQTTTEPGEVEVPADD